jgi:hypothetical protein
LQTLKIDNDQAYTFVFNPIFVTHLDISPTITDFLNCVLEEKKTNYGYEGHANKNDQHRGFEKV